MKLNPGQGHTRWALERRLTSLRRYLGTAADERRREMEAEIVELEDALDAPNKSSQADVRA